MSDDETERYSAFEHGFIVPIAGLLSVVFVGMAGVTAASALQGSLEFFVLTVIFAASGLLCFWIRKRRLEAMTEE